MRARWRRQQTRNDFIIYNERTGALIYDRNGDDKGGAVKVAVLAPDLDLSKADFFVVLGGELRVDAAGPEGRISPTVNYHAGSGRVCGMPRPPAG